MFSSLLKRFSYTFPPECIAQAPASPRDSARLLIYDRKTKKTHIDTFLNLPLYVPRNAVIVLNNTKVIPARLTLIKKTGGTVRVLYISHTTRTIKVLADRRLMVGSTLTLNKNIRFYVRAQHDNQWELNPTFPIRSLYAVLERHGATPIPPYIKHTPLSPKELKKDYQTLFAKQKGSVAAPTASLHFSKRVLKKLKARGCVIAYITLHVGLGTFAPLTDAMVSQKKLHKETYSIDSKTLSILNKTKKEKRPIIAVGTTVVRALESSSNARGVLKKRTGETSLFITEQYRPRFIDQLITNFHVPQSSLLMLVSAFVPRTVLLALYRLALSKKFRFFSFGDGMYVR